MAKRRSLFDYLRDRLLILLTADDDFVGEVIKTETSLWSSILGFLRRFTQSDGNLVNDETSRRLSSDIARQTRKIIKDSTLSKKVDLFIPNFERVERLTGQIYEDIIGSDAVIPDLSAARQLAIDEILSAFSETKGLESAFEIPLRQRIFQAVTQEMPFNEAVEFIREYVRGTTPKGGELAKYSRTVATDLINGFSGYADYQVAKANGLDGFYLSGSLINTSRETCIHMINGTGEFADLAIEPGLFAVADMDKIVELGRNNPGWRPETTADTYPIFRNGYNCRHPLIFVPLSNEEKAKRERVKNASDRLKNFKPDQ